LQFAPVGQGPLQYQSFRSAWQVSLDHLQRLNIKQSNVLAIHRMKMWC